MTDTVAPKATQLWDFRTGGPINQLLVYVERAKNPCYELWTVDYDRWRDEHWTVGRALHWLHATEGGGSTDDVCRAFLNHQACVVPEAEAPVVPIFQRYPLAEQLARDILTVIANHQTGDTLLQSKAGR